MMPTTDDLKNPLFNAIWEIIQKWEIQRTREEPWRQADGCDVLRLMESNGQVENIRSITKYWYLRVDKMTFETLVDYHIGPILKAFKTILKPTVEEREKRIMDFLKNEVDQYGAEIFHVHINYKDNISTTCLQGETIYFVGLFDTLLFKFRKQTRKP